MIMFLKVPNFFIHTIALVTLLQPVFGSDLDIIPSKFYIHSIEPRRFIAPTNSFACVNLLLSTTPKHISYSGVDLKSFEVGIQSVREAVINLSKNRSVEKVLYPAAGTNAGLPFLIFPEAKSCILIDNHPFIYNLPSPEGDISTFEPDSYRFHLRDGIDADLTIGISPLQRIVGELMSVIKNVRILSAEIFSSVPETQWKVLEVRSDPVLGVIYDSPELHGLIRFDTGDGTPIKHVLYINSQQRQKGNTWWKDLLFKRPPQALIVKASMQIFLQRSDKYDPNLHDFLKQLIQYSQRMILVEGRKRFLDGQTHWEFSGETTKEDNGLIFENVPFGYDSAVRVSRTK